MIMDDDEVPDLLEVDDIPEAGPSSPRRNTFDRPKIPITLLTGYLGAGKSTLLEYILTAVHGYRIAVCMNDFGDTTDIEAKSLTLNDPETGEQSTSFLSLPNGCLCCSVKDLGIAAIEDMVASQRGKIDWVMVELTGVADPGPIAKSFWSNEEMGDLVLDGIVCVVDSKNILKQLGETGIEGAMNEAQRQLAASDIILLNKVDLVDTDQLSAVENRVHGINPTLHVHKTVKGKMPLKHLFNLRAFSSSNMLLQDGREDTPSTNGHTHEDHEHHPDGSTHHSDVSTVLIPLPQLSNEQFSRLNAFLETLLWEWRIPVKPGVSRTESTRPTAGSNDTLEVLRCKGYIPVDDGRRYVLQGVMDIFEMTELARQGTLGGAEGGKVVFIGRGVESLKPGLLSYLGL